MAFKMTGLPGDARRGLRQVQLAQISGDGSIAKRDDPNNYGSIMSRKYPGLFGPNGMANPEHVARQAQQQHYAGLRQRVNDHRYVDSLITPDDRRQQIDQNAKASVFGSLRKKQLLTDPYFLDDALDWGDTHGY